ncbi:MAG TPA: SDR family oxidoreductase [Thermomonospora sp.]|nr:SDR family oxidoreductase [Thermomonospora sp.]
MAPVSGVAARVQAGPDDVPVTRRRVFLVAGATGPTGEATVRLMAARGDRMVLTGRNASRLEELRVRYGRQVATYTGDVSRPEEATRAVGQARRVFGRLDGLVHMIGGLGSGPAARTTPATHERLLHANFLSAVVTTQAVLPHLSRPSWLVYIGSLAATSPPPNFGAYAAAKAALTAWARALARETEHLGVHVNVVQTAPVGTPPQPGEARLVTPSEVAHVVVFLTSPNGLSGSVVPVPGRRADTGDAKPAAPPN